MELVRVRGLNRRGVRVGSKIITSSATTVINLDDGPTRRDVSKHSAIGALFVVGDALAAFSSGVVASAGTTLSFSVSAGVLAREDGNVTVAGVSNSALTAADATNPRIDLIVVDAVTGATSKVDGTAAASPVAPVTPSGKIPVATVRVAALATTAAGTTYTDVAPRL